MKCEQCIYFDEEVCKRYPPAISAALDSKDEIVPFLGYPSVELDDWCGEFKSDAKH